VDRYAVEEELLNHSPAVHVRRPRLDCESHATALDRNEVGALLVEALVGDAGCCGEGGGERARQDGDPGIAEPEGRDPPLVRGCGRVRDPLEGGADAAGVPLFGQPFLTGRLGRRRGLDVLLLGTAPLLALPRAIDVP
jgi:hypothetical protein